jgi:predicted branched-subunit amino acid permease
MTTLRHTTSTARPGPGRAGVRDAVTVITAYVPFGVAVGAALTSTHVPPLLGWSTSLFVFAGAAQLLAVQMLSSGAAGGLVVAAALVLNARHLLYSASLAGHVVGWSRPARAVAAYLLADPVWALATARFESDRTDRPTDRLRYYLAMGLTVWLGWLGLTGLGALLAGALPRSVPLELAVPLTFLLLLRSTLTGSATYAAAASAAVVAVAAHGLPLGIGLLVAAVVGIVVGASVGRRRDG